jgi:hypothetical protein
MPYNCAVGTDLEGSLVGHQRRGRRHRASLGDESRKVNLDVASLAFLPCLGQKTTNLSYPTFEHRPCQTCAKYRVLCFTSLVLPSMPVHPGNTRRELALNPLPRAFFQFPGRTLRRWRRYHFLQPLEAEARASEGSHSQDHGSYLGLHGSQLVSSGLVGAPRGDRVRQGLEPVSNLSRTPPASRILLMPDAH